MGIYSCELVGTECPFPPHKGIFPKDTKLTSKAYAVESYNGTLFLWKTNP